MAMTALGNQYLREMGIDVWVLRRKIPHEPDAAVVQAVVPLPAIEPAPAEAVAASPVPEFHLCFMTWPGFSLVFSLPRDADGVHEGLRRFAGDVGLAMGAKDAPTVNAVRWPMVQSRHIDQSEHAARAVLRQRLDQCANLVLVFGDEVAGWLDEAGMRQTYTVRDMGAYLAEPLAKRELWHTLTQARAEMRQ